MLSSNVKHVKYKAAVSSYLSSLHTLELHIQVHQLCTNNKHNTYLDPPLGGFGRKVDTHVHCAGPYFIPTKFGQHPSIGSVRKAMCSHTYACISDPHQPFLHINFFLIH